MQRIIKNTDTMVEDMLSGFLKAHKEIVAGGRQHLIIPVQQLERLLRYLII